MVLESKPAPMLAMYVGGSAAGLLLMYLARNFTFARSNELAGFLLGCLILGLSVAALLVGEGRRVELDEGGRRVILDITRRWGARRRIEIQAAGIQDIAIGALGDRSDGTRYYDLVVKRRDGGELYLFGGCVFEGRMDRDQMEGLRQHFRGVLGLPG